MSYDSADSSVDAPEKDSATDPADGVEVTEGTQDGETSKETPSPQEKRLADTEEALKERQREFHEMSQKLAELKGQMSAMSQQQQPPVKDPLDDEALAASLRDDPSKVLSIIKQREAAQMSQVAAVLEARDRFWQNELQKVSPEVVAMRDKIAEFRKDPDLKDFSDQQLATIARKQAAPRVQYRGAPGEGQRTAQSKQADITETALWKQIYPDWTPPSKK
jgi:hypothetical protein